tara:strand:- start:5359 stop:6483 length:1125 start_codon:yes stop_codon:yes gene_type:complete
MPHVLPRKFLDGNIRQVDSKLPNKVSNKNAKGRKILATKDSSKKYSFKSYFDAINFFYEKGWTDGLPIVPPTPDLVTNMINGTNLHRNEIIGFEPVKGREISIEKIAINAVMAGCDPTYFPVVVSAVKGLLKPEFNLHAITASTMGAAVLAVVSGPLARQIGINGKVNVFGPGHRANAAIGRAIRLIIINATGSKSGEIDKGTLGHAGRYTWCITENDEANKWDPIGVERGISLNENSVTLFAGLSPIQVSNHSSSDPEVILRSFRDALFATGQGQGEIVIVLCPEHAHNIFKAGWTKVRIKDYLYELSARTDNEWGFGSINPGPKPEGKSISHSTLDPEGFTILVAGGFAGAFSQVIPLWGGGSNSQSVTMQI